MQHGLRNPARSSSTSKLRSKHSPRQGGYILLTLIFLVAVGAIATLALTYDLGYIKQQNQRDREDELRHRGTQYMRAIRAYYKKLGRYPAKVEDLESTNNLRFLRRRYKDPLTGEDFKLLHYGDSGVKLSGGIGGPVQPGNPNGNPATPPGATALNRVLNQNNPNPTQADPNSTDTSQTPDAKNPGSGNTTSGNPSEDANGNPKTADSKGDKEDADQPTNGPTFGGGAIVGVASISKKESIREFNHKHRYNQWLFYYDPQADRGGLLNGPTVPQALGFGLQGQQPGGLNGTPPNTPGALGGPAVNPGANPAPEQAPAPIGDPPPS